MAGHLFIMRGDIRALACDAWLLPTDSRQHIMASWRWDWPRGFTAPVEPPIPAYWRRGSMRPWPHWPAELSQPWLVAVGAATAVGASWPAASASLWLDTVAASLRGTPPRHGRAKHLVALPALGTGSGGQRAHSGDVLRELLPALQAGATRHDLDVALVCYEPDTFAAARAVRGTAAGSWPELSAAELGRVAHLARLAGDGELVLFLGAGVSKGAGVPDWKSLVGDLARHVGIDPTAPGWSELDVTDQASLVQRGIKSGSLGELVADRVRRPEAALQHFLLASLPVGEAVTTNYDDLFELASSDRVSVIPHRAEAAAPRWLLKMHGCVTKPDDVVLTRADYLRYEQRRVALAGIVQAMLMTRHMLFVGFSLKDENFHRVADAVRRALGPTGRKFGTVLKLEPEKFVQELWDDELDFVTTETARKLEIFLDALLAHAPHDPLHFLQHRFTGTLTDGERAFREELVQLLQRIPADARQGAAWERLQALVASLGGR